MIQSQSLKNYLKGSFKLGGNTGNVLPKLS